MIARLCAGLDALSEWTGRAVAWLTLAMVLVGTAVVVMRYALGIGYIWLQETVTWAHAAVFMLGAAYTLQRDQHVRVDVLYRGLAPRAQAAIDLAGTLLFLLPLCAFLAWKSWPYVELSWELRERSREAGGLPALFLLKALMPLTALLLGLQGLAGGLRAALRLRDG